jgi:hypothetical protein
MLIFYALEKRSPWFIFAFALSCMLASAYGFLQGIWPFGVVEAIWSVSGAPSLVASENSHLKLAASGYFKYFSGS